MLVGVLLIKGYFCPVFLNYVVMPRKCLVTVQLVDRGLSVIAMTFRKLTYSDQSSVHEISPLTG